MTTRVYSGSGANLTVPEDSTVNTALASFTDSDTADVAGQFSAVINWGDGTSTVGTVEGGDGQFSVYDTTGHTYNHEGTYATSITITDSADNVSKTLVGSVTATEADVLTVAAAPAISATADLTFSGQVAGFTDSIPTNTASNFAATINWGDGTTSAGTITAVNGAIAVDGTHTYAAGGSDAVTVTLTDKYGTASATANGTATVAAMSVFTLTTGVDTLIAGKGNNLFIATSNTLSQGDVVQGGNGVNQLDLVGGGTFNLTLPTTLLYMETLSAQEGIGSAEQIITLRPTTCFVDNVASGPAGAGIIIYGAQNQDIINLGTGYDTVVLGTGETVNGGGGHAVYEVNQQTIRDNINGGNVGTNTLVTTDTGHDVMGTNLTGITAVQLSVTTAFTANATANMTITGSAAGGDTITLGAASQSVIGGGPGEWIKVTAAEAGALVTKVGVGSELEITTGGTATLNPETSVGTVKLDAATNLTLSSMSFINVIGSTGADTINAEGTFQTLTGGAGADMLNGFSGGYDTFRDIASGLNGDTIGNFVSTDSIDLTNVALTPAILKVTASGANTIVNVTSAGLSSTFTMTGSWSASGFKLASDGSVGLLITHS